jgi:hypothetical protein
MRMIVARWWMTPAPSDALKRLRIAELRGAYLCDMLGAGPSRLGLRGGVRVGGRNIQREP